MAWAQYLRYRVSGVRGRGRHQLSLLMENEEALDLKHGRLSTYFPQAISID
jgi:hypothetical protein